MRYFLLFLLERKQNTKSTTKIFHCQYNREKIEITVFVKKKVSKLKLYLPR